MLVGLTGFLQPRAASGERLVPGRVFAPHCKIRQWNSETLLHQGMIFGNCRIPLLRRRAIRRGKVVIAIAQVKSKQKESVEKLSMQSSALPMN